MKRRMVGRKTPPPAKRSLGCFGWFVLLSVGGILSLALIGAGMTPTPAPAPAYTPPGQGALPGQIAAHAKRVEDAEQYQASIKARRDADFAARAAAPAKASAKASAKDACDSWLAVFDSYYRGNDRWKKNDRDGVYNEGITWADRLAMRDAIETKRPRGCEL